MAFLFPDDLTSTTDDATFATLKEKFNKYDSNYLWAASEHYIRVCFENLWANHMPYSDPNFISEAQKHFHQRSWEMFISNYLQNKDFELLTNDDKSKLGIRRG